MYYPVRPTDSVNHALKVVRLELTKRNPEFYNHVELCAVYHGKVCTEHHRTFSHYGMEQEEDIEIYSLVTVCSQCANVAVQHELCLECFQGQGD